MFGFFKGVLDTDKVPEAEEQCLEEPQEGEHVEQEQTKRDSVSAEAQNMMFGFFKGVIAKDEEPVPDAEETPLDEPKEGEHVDGECVEEDPVAAEVVQRLMSVGKLANTFPQPNGPAGGEQPLSILSEAEAMDALRVLQQQLSETATQLLSQPRRSEQRRELQKQVSALEEQHRAEHELLIQTRLRSNAQLQASAANSVKVPKKYMIRNRGTPAKPRRAAVARLFQILDVDQSGWVTNTSFWQMMQAVDQTVELDDVNASFERLGEVISEEGIPLSSFEVWMYSTFAGLEQYEFVSECEMMGRAILLGARNKAAELIFKSMDPLAEGVVCMDQFHKVMHAVDPEVTAENLEVALQRVGVPVDEDICVERFTQWLEGALGGLQHADYLRTCKVIQSAVVDEMREQTVRKMFVALDSRKMGALPLEEFYRMMQGVDPSIRLHELHSGLLEAQVSLTGGIDFEGLEQWLDHTRGSLQLTSFVQECQALTSSMLRGIEQCPMPEGEELRKLWACMLFYEMRVDSTGGVDRFELASFIKETGPATCKQQLETTAAPGSRRAVEYEDFCNWLDQLFVAIAPDEQLMTYRPLVKAAQQARRSFQRETGSLSQTQKHAANRTFEVFDKNRTGACCTETLVNALTAMGAVNWLEVQQTLQQVGATAAGMSRQTLYCWLALTLGDFQESTFCDSCMELMLSQSPLNESRREWADQLFSTYDFDCGGTIDLDELTALMKNHDAQVQSADVQGTIWAVGAKDELDLYDFHLWVALVFGSLNEQQFVESVSSLLGSAPPPKDFELNLRQHWALKLFQAYDTNQTGEISKIEFARLVKQLIPNASTKDVQMTMARAGATKTTLNLAHLTNWAMCIFEDSNDEKYVSCMTLLVESASETAQLQLAGPSLVENEASTNPTEPIPDKKGVSVVIQHAQAGTDVPAPRPQPPQITSASAPGPRDYIHL